MHCLCLAGKQIYSLNCCHRISLTITSTTETKFFFLKEWPNSCLPELLSGKKSKTVTHLFSSPVLVALVPGWLQAATLVHWASQDSQGLVQQAQTTGLQLTLTPLLSAGTGLLQKRYMSHHANQKAFAWRGVPQKHPEREAALHKQRWPYQWSS